jgi:O-antigen/teichoic acid export membrane protein
VTYYVAINRDYATAICYSLRIPFLLQISVLPIIHFFILRLYLSEQPNQIVLAGYFTIAVTPGFVAQQYGLAILQGLKVFRPFNIMRLMPATAYSVVILLVFVVRVGTLPVVIFSWMCVNSIVGITTFYIAHKRASSLQASFHSVGNPSFKRMLQFGIKGLIGALSPLENFRLDHLVAGLLLSPAALGLYVVAQAFTNLPRFIAQSIGMVAYPAMSSCLNTTGETKRTLNRFIGVTAAFNGFLVLFLTVFLPVLIPFFFGNEFSESINIARLLLFGAFLASCRQIIVVVLRGLGKPEVSTWTELSMYPFLVIFGPLLIGSYYLTGVALTVISCYFLSLIISLYFLKNYLKENY